MSADETLARVKLVENEIQSLLQATQDLVRVSRQHEGRIANLERLFQQLVEMHLRADERADRADERAREADARMDRFDARMDRFVETVEKYIKSGGSNGAGGNGAGSA